MCGIYLTNFDFSEQYIEKKLEKINFRGPDFFGQKKYDNVSLAHLRLSIIDLDSRSNQPMEYEDLSITFNGEIYNYKDIKKELISEGYKFKTTSDTEVLLMGYHCWGEKIMPKLNGMFALAIYNRKEKTVFCARDRIGVKPLYYSWKNNLLEICSQPSPMEKKEELDFEAINIYLQTSYIPSPYSIYKDISKLQPGYYAYFDLNKNTFSQHQYWDLKKVKTKKISYSNAKKQLHELLTDAIKIRLNADVPYGCFLSGGIDSALVSAISQKLLATKKLKTFTIGFDDAKFDESQLAKQFSNIIDTKHTSKICTEKELLKLIPKLFETYDEPFADSSQIPSLLLNKTVKKHLTVALSGDGGDESFFGYNHFEWIKKIRLFILIPLFMRRILLKSILLILPNFNDKFKNLVIIKNLNEGIYFIFTILSNISKYKEKKWKKYYNQFVASSSHYLQKLADLNIKLWLENDSCVKVDRASMAYSVEVRSPFLDYRIIEFARTLPLKYRYKGDNRKRILKDILSEYIPQKVFEAPKKGFAVPIKKWINNELKTEIIQTLDDSFFEKIKMIDKTAFTLKLENHFKGKSDESANIWKVYVLSKWMKINGF